MQWRDFYTRKKLFCKRRSRGRKQILLKLATGSGPWWNARLERRKPVSLLKIKAAGSDR